MSTSVLLLVFALTGRNYEIINNFLPCAITVLVQGSSRAILFIFTRRFVNHGWGSAIGLHIVILCIGQFLRQCSLASEIGYTVIDTSQWFLACQSMLIYCDNLALLEECRGEDAQVK